MRAPRSFTSELLDASSSFAQSAITAYEADQTSIFLLHAATALEQLAKALLASRHPSLLIDRDIDALLHAVGLPEAAKRPPSRMRTIGMDAALQRCSLIIPALTRLDKQMAILREARNGLVHLGLSSGTSSEVLVPWLQATDLLLAEIPIRPEEYWERALRFVDQTTSQAIQSVSNHVEALIRASKGSFAQRFRETDHAWKNEVIRISVSSYEVDRLERQLWPCPACETDALAEGQVEPEYEFEEEVDDGQFMVHAELQSLTFYVHRLHCRVCGLRLEGARQLVAAGVPDNWTLEDPDLDQVNAWEARWAEFEP